MNQNYFNNKSNIELSKKLNRKLLGAVFGGLTGLILTGSIVITGLIDFYNNRRKSDVFSPYLYSALGTLSLTTIGTLAYTSKTLSNFYKEYEKINKDINQK